MKLQTQLFLGYVLIFVLMIVIAAVTYQGITALTETAEWVSHTHQVISKAHRIEKLVVDMETGQRGFLITGTEEFLQPYDEGVKAYETTMADLKLLVSDNSTQVERLNQIEALVAHWQSVAAMPEIATRRNVIKGAIDADYLQTILEKGVGKGILDEMRGIMDDMTAGFRIDGNVQGELLIMSVAKNMVDQETGQRGFLITGKEEFLEPFRQGQEDLKEGITALQTLVAEAYNNVPEMKRHVDELEKLAADWIKEAATPEIAARVQMNKSTTSMKDVVALIEQGTGKAVMDSLRVKLSEFIGVENELLASRDIESEAVATRTDLIVIFGTIIAIALGIMGMLFVTRSILRQIGGEPAVIAGVTEQIAKGNLDVEIEGRTGIGASVGVMLKALRENQDQNERQDWLKTGIARLNEAMQGDLVIMELASKVISEISTYLDVQVGAIYLAGNGDGTALSLLGSYAYKKRKDLSNVFKLGEGLVGQAALEKQQILIKNVPEDYVKITSGLGERIPRFISVTPFISEDRVKGVVEVGTLNEMTDQQLEYLAQAMPALAIAVESAQSRTNLAKSLEQSQALSEELQTQQEELRSANEELEEQTQMLTESEAKLKAQQEELQVTNEELEEKTEVLEQQKRGVEEANEELEITRQEIEEKAEELALASKYKSEFLANMSHELRTPLNSLLILGSTLAENEEGNLTEDQVESAKVILSSGNDLLALINEILDLSKIEAGQMSLDLNDVQIRDLADSTKTSFQHMVKDKGLELKVSIAKNTPKYIRGDRRRIEQVIKNLMSNALKFTDKGEITVSFSRPGKKADLSRSGLDSDKAVAISVKDTGMGIPAAKQKIIFEAFQQAEGGTARKYGGTGLGLSISRELVRLHEGEIQLESEEGKGSVFTVYFPVKMGDVNGMSAAPLSVPPSIRKRANRKAPTTQVVAIPDDREDLEDDDTVILIIEDDAKFAQVLMNECHGKGFKCLVSATGEEGLELAEKYQPKAVLLDILLPGIDGWTVLSMLKDQTDIRHIPVHVISAVEGASVDALQRGAIGYLEKPVNKDELAEAFARIEDIFSRKVKNLLVVEDDENVRKNIVKLVGNGDVHADETATGKETLEKLKSGKYDCMILDLGLPDMTGIELLEILAKSEDIATPPVIVYTSRELTREEDTKLREFAESVIIKGARSEERLLDEASLFLHRVVGKLPTKKRKMIADLHDVDSIFKNKRVLIVDDDMRNVFALSKTLGDKGIETLKAEDGKKALSLLEKDPDIDLVLMDIMMPVMDGYETMKRIRAQEKFQQLPIIALTAKAMKEDRSQCIAAGANDYLPKPVNLDRLFSTMRVWLYR